MNLREGTRRLALLLGVAGAIYCGVFSYVQLQSTMRQRADHRRFERLANSRVVQQDRESLLALAKRNGGWIISDPPPKTLSGKLIDTKALASAVNRDGIREIGWSEGYKRVVYLETQDDQLIYPTPAPGVWSYILVAVLPLAGFFIPWGIIRAIGWVVAGFGQPFKSES